MIWTDVFGCITPRSPPTHHGEKEEQQTSSVVDTKSPAYIASASKQAGLKSLLGEEIDTSDVCKFCNITSKEFNIITETERFVVFTDRDPGARIHLLAIPRTHIANTRDLHGEQGARLVEELMTIGRKALEIADSKQCQQRNSSGNSGNGKGDGEDCTSELKETRFGFHIPPFRSVDHLHLHCLALPFRSSLKALKYRVAPGDPPASYKGWGWFVTADQAIAILRAGRSIDVEPC